MTCTVWPKKGDISIHCDNYNLGCSDYVYLQSRGNLYSV